MSDSPTTAGSIVGKLRLDKSQWDADSASAKADARELGALEPTIKVDAKVGDALAKLEGVRIASENLGFANERLKIAYQRLDEVQTKGGASESRLMALHLAAAKAEAAQVTATNKLTSAKQALADADAVAAARAEALANDENKVDEANKKVAASSGLNANRTMLIVAAVAALIPMLAPLAGYAVGVGGALAGMGAAGVLAIFGIASEMKQGTAAGIQFSAGIDSLLGNFHQLAATASNGVLTSFNSAVRILNQAMPSLNAQISMFAGMLGVTALAALRGVLNAFQVLNPLFIQAGQYVQLLAIGFEQWTANGGLEKFTTLAMATFPQVVQALGALAMGALNLIQAFAPLGTVLLGVLAVVGNVVSVLTTGLGPAFAPIVAGALAAWGAFKLFQLVTPILESAASAMTALGLSVEVSTGPIGWVVAGVSALIAVLGVVAASQANATQAAQDYAVALQQDNDAIGKNVQALAAKSLHDSGAIASAHQLGITTKELTDAAIGNADAQSKVSGVLSGVEKGLKTVGSATGSTSAEQQKQALAAITVRDALKSQGEALSSAQKQQKELADATANTDSVSAGLAQTYGMSVENFNAASDAQKKNADSAAATTRQLQLENDAATLLTNAFNLLNGTNLSVAQAQTAAAAATNSLTDSLKTNGLEIDGNSKAAISNQQALQQKAAADQAAAEAIAKQTGSTEAGTKAFAVSKQALIDQLKATGQLTPAIQALIDKYYAVPPVVKTKADLDADAAIQRAAALKAWLDSLTSKTIVVTVQTNAVGAPVNTAGAPGTLRKYADGGTVGGSGGPKADTVAAYLSVGEEVTPNPQAGRYRATLKALAADNIPAARASLGGGGGGNVTLTVVNKTGMTLSDLIDIRIDRNNQQTRTALTSGVQKGAY